MSRLALVALLAASFLSAGVAVAYFSDTRETVDIVRGGPPIPWLKLWSQGTDPLNTDALAANDLTYVTQNDVTPATPAATGKMEGAVETLAVNLGDRDAGNITWKKTSPANAEVNGRFNRLFTVETPSDLPIGVGQTVGLRLEQENAVPALSSGNLMFSAMEFAVINATANDEFTSAFRGLTPSATVNLLPGQKRQVNVSMADFGQTSVDTDRVVNTAIRVIVTTPDGDDVRYRVPITVCNHVERCPA